MPADFPIPFNDRLISFSPSAGTTLLDGFDFPIYENTGIAVIRIRSGTVTTLTLTTDYTVSINADQEADPGGTVTLVTASIASDTYILLGATTVERTTDFQQRGGWQASEINEQFDRIILMLQEMKRVGLAWDSHTTATIGAVPYDIAANQFIRRNSGNTDWEAVTVATSGTSVQTASTTVEGTVELSTDAEYVAKSLATRAITPSNLAAAVSFLAHKNGINQTAVTSATAVKLTFPTEQWDIGGYYDATTSIFTPPAGKYRISANALFTSANGVDNETLRLLVYKNGAQHRRNGQTRGAAGSDNACVDVLVEANGTDTFEVYAFKSGAGDGTIDGGTTDTWFCAEQVA